MALTSASTINSSFLPGHDYPYTHYVPVPSNLNNSFINNNTGANLEVNVSDIKTTFSRDASGNLSITETLDPIDTLAQQTQ